MYHVMRAESVEPIRRWAIEFMDTLGEEVDSDHFLAQWEKFLSWDMGVVYYLTCNDEVVGGIGAIKTPSILSGKTELIEIFWYVTPDHRRRGIELYNAMEKYFMDSPDISRFAMIHMEQSMAKKLTTFYKKKGFRLLETHWIKER